MPNEENPIRDMPRTSPEEPVRTIRPERGRIAEAALNLVERPNEGALVLEQTLGLSFGDEKPREVVVNKRGAVLLALTQSQRHLLGPNLLRTMTGGAGAYVPELDLVIINEAVSGSISASLHENAHAWTSRQEGKLNEALSEHRRLKHLLQMDEDTEELSVNTGAAYMCVQEGMADWIRINARRRIDTGPEEENREHRKYAKWDMLKLLTSNPDKQPEWSWEIPEGRVEQNARESYEVIKRGLEEAQEMAQRGSVQALQGFLGYIQRCQPFLYPLGYTYVHMYMEKAAEQGINIEEALKAIIQNPPETLEEIIEYIDPKSKEDTRAD
ncbi:hypothetical protein JXA34_04015 [Patescibacteria group bacterium]|nr:hypothetical protein [Patescibacteria group bacterium]